MLTIDNATPEDAADLAARLIPDDAAELAAAGLTVADCMEGTEAEALRWNGQLVCLFGVVAHPSALRSGIPWMLCTDTLVRVPRLAMAKVCDDVVTGWMLQFAHLSNLVHRRNLRALRFLRWLGFAIGTTPCGPRQEFFVFEWSKPCATR